MDKVLIILSDNNKGKFISKGFSSAFKSLSYFVIERKIYDLNTEEVNHIKPQIIFVYWTDMTQKDVLIDFLQKYNGDARILHCSELEREIPQEYKNNSNYIFASDNEENALKPAVDGREYKSRFVKYNYDITFCGNPASVFREEILAALILNIGGVNIFCRSFDFYKSLDEIYKLKLLDEKYIEIYKNSYKGYVDTPKELANIYVSSKINLDIKNENEKYINYRCLEIAASGGFVIAPYNKTVIKYFDDGKDIETYNDKLDLIDKIRFYLKNLNIAQLIASNGRRNVLNNHSFCDRLKSILEVVYGKDFGNR